MDSLPNGDVHASNGGHSGSWSSSSSSNDSPDVEGLFDGNPERKRGSRESQDIALFPKKPRVHASTREFLTCVKPEPLAVQVVEEEVLEAVPILERFPVVDAENLWVPRACKQFWKAGDYKEGSHISNTNNADNKALCTVGMDHVRVHPRFLHSNATSHKWALGAFAELLDNALDEVCNGATYVNIDVIQSMKDDSKMLVVEDNGGGMTPDKMRQCMSLGYSAKSKMANTIGQYGNGFKTSTMRLGADVLVFSRCQGSDGQSATQSIGMLSYTFLRGAGKEDIVVPMVDFEKRGQVWSTLVRSSMGDWHGNLEIIIQWSPYMSDTDLFQQFNFLGDQGTRIIIYNLWEDDEGDLELDFDADPNDIQLRGEPRNEKNIKMANDYPNSRHFLTYQHSLRSYASILYLKLPSNFRMTLRGKEIVHHNIVNDMMHVLAFTYKPKSVSESMVNDADMVATVTLGFVKDAEHHIDIQGFNVYHKNRLIKPFWRVWNAAGSSGRGVIGVLEANFVEPAHDKQGFERTIVLSRLEARLVKMQKDYWFNHSHKVGYAGRPSAKNPPSGKKDAPSIEDKPFLQPTQNGGCSIEEKRPPSYNSTNFTSCNETSPAGCELNRKGNQTNRSLHSKLEIKVDKQVSTERDMGGSIKLKEENCDLRERLNRMGGELQYKGDKCRSLELQLKEAHQKLEELDKEQLALIDVLVEERKRRDQEEEKLRKKLREASVTIEELLNKVRLLESRGLVGCKVER